MIDIDPTPEAGQECSSLRPTNELPTRRLARTTMARTLAAIVVSLAALSGAAGTAGATTTPGVAATPGNDGSHPWPSNGCGPTGRGVLIPDSVKGVFNFNHACDHHDGCYGGFQRNGRATYWYSRSACDAQFRSDMLASCRWQHGSNLRKTWASLQCASLSTTYWLAVRASGSGAYKGPKKLNN